MAMVVEFIENLERKIKMVHSIPTTDESISNLVRNILSRFTILYLFFWHDIVTV